MAHQSLASALDEDYIETLASLDSSNTSHRKGSANINRPMRTTLDADHPTPRHGSIAGIGVGITSPRDRKPASSRALDPADPSTWTSPHSSKPSSPTITRSTPVVTQAQDEPDQDQIQEYVGVTRDPDASSNPHRSMSDSGPSRATNNGHSPVLAADLSGKLQDLQLGSSEVKEKHNLQKAAGHSRSPSGRVISNPADGRPSTLSPHRSSPVVKGHAHHPSSSFSTVGSGSDMDRVRVDTAEDDHVVEESSDEHSSDSEGESRGRERKPKLESPPPEQTSSPELTKAQTPTSPEPSISVTSPAGEDITQPSVGLTVPPAPGEGRRASVSTIASTDGDENDIAKAKTLGLSISPLDTTVPDRHVRMILRGDWLSYHKEVEAGERSARTYLACSDLSVEANYALEWTVGTILRDGDTLLCVYSIEDETAGTGSGSNNKVSEAEKEQLHQEGAQAGKDAMNVMEGLTRQTTNRENSPMTTFIPATEAKSLTGSVDARTVSKKEMERLKAIDEITQTFLRLVRKTSLQVRCMIEVIHCKSPKHLILGAVSASVWHTTDC
jgi:hypothetical protein